MIRPTCQLPRGLLLIFGLVAPSLLCSAAEAQQVIHRVRINESLRTISADYYGHKRHATLLRKVNGLSKRRKLKVASRLRIPSAWIHITTRRRSLRALAKRYLGDRRRYVALHAFNPELRNRMRVPANTKVLVPFAIAHIVSSRDSYIKLARRYYKDGGKAKLIAQYNFLKGTRPTPGSLLRIPIETRITPARLRALTNERVLGISSGGPDRDRQALIEANASLRQGRYWYVPLALLRMLAHQLPSASRVVDVFKLLAVAYVALDQRDLAVLAFKEALLRQPNLQLSPMNTSPKVIKAFAAAQGAARRDK